MIILACRCDIKRLNRDVAPISTKVYGRKVFIIGGRHLGIQCHTYELQFESLKDQDHIPTAN